MHLGTRFRKRARAATESRETTPNMSFGPKVVDWACSLQKNKRWFRRHNSMDIMPSGTHFHNGARAATESRETTPNVSFGPKVVDWACSLRKNKKWFRWHKLAHIMHPETHFRNEHAHSTT